MAKNINGYNIRYININDSEQLYKLYLQLSPNGEYNKEVMKSKIADCCRYSGFFCWATFSDDGLLIATATLWVLPTLLRGGTNFGQIENVVVDEGFRGKGLGKMLIEIALKKAKTENCYKVILNCDMSRCGFYESCGFVSNEVTMRKDIAND